MIESGDIPVRQEGTPSDQKDRRWRAREKLHALFFDCPTHIPGEILGGNWSRGYLKLFADGDTELLAWARDRDLPSSLLELAQHASGQKPQHVSIFEQLRQLRPEVAFRPEHLSQYRLGKLRGNIDGEFVGPYGMPAIGTVLPLVAGLIIASRWPDFLDAPRPERRPENNSWKLTRRLGTGTRETRSWHW